MGGTWHALAFGRGVKIDTHLTPVGQIGGVFIHANYIEALLDSRTYVPWEKWKLQLIEVLLSFAAAAIFALAKRKIRAILCLCVGVAVFNYFLWQNLKVFGDFFIPVVLLGGHSAVEQILEWREMAHSGSHKQRKKP